MFFRAVTTPLITPVPNFNKWCAVSNLLFKNIDFCIFTPKTTLVKENYFLTLWNFTYLKDTSFGKKSCNFEHGIETKNEFEKWPLITFFQCRIVRGPDYSPASELFARLRKTMTGNNPNLYLVNIDAHKKIGQILSICSDINQGL